MGHNNRYTAENMAQQLTSLPSLRITIPVMVIHERDHNARGNHKAMDSDVYDAAVDVVRI